jgi:hypothetical protein
MCCPNTTPRRRSSRNPGGCDQKLKLLTRTATNTYFPPVYTVISLPSEKDALIRLVDSLGTAWDSLCS